jgi:hypothetical protein
MISADTTRRSRDVQEEIRDIAADWWVLANQSAVFRESNLSSICPLGDVSGEGKAYCNIGDALDSLSRYDEAIEHHKKHLEISQQTGGN